MELHTFSSLNKSFLDEYRNSMNIVDKAIIYYNATTLKQKRLKTITNDDIKKSFNRDDLIVFTNSNKLRDYLNSIKNNNHNILLMSSGNFNGMNIF